MVDLPLGYPYNAPMVTCIVLAAGESRRFGSPKALASVDDKAAIGRVTQMLAASTVDAVIVVLGANAQAIEPQVFNHKKVSIVHNKDYKLGQTSSVQTGFRAVGPGASAIMVLPVDCPWVSTATVTAMVAYFKENRPLLLVPSYQGKRGHPLLLNSVLKETILQLTPAEGLNTLFNDNPVSVLEVDDPGVLKTFNTPEELNRLTT